MNDFLKELAALLREHGAKISVDYDVVQNRWYMSIKIGNDTRDIGSEADSRSIAFLLP